MEKKKSVFERLSAINVNDHVEKKKDLTYLSWAWAWSVTKKECPDATYKILPTEYDEALGFMCHSEVTIESETLEMWLPVMDGANKSMLKKPYTYKGTAWENGRKVQVEKTVDAATTFDINKTMMRCLVKNLAMFGLGIYIYAGEDLPETEGSTPEPVRQAPATAKVAPTEAQFAGIVQYLNGTPDQQKTAREALKKYSLTKDQQEIIEGL
jgi:hypothetical protein